MKEKEEGMSNIICKALGIRYPIILGGMAGIGRARLTAAVSDAGALGLLGAGPWNGSELKAQIRRVRDLTGKTFGVNIPVGSEHAEDLIETVIAEGVQVVATSAGDPQRFTPKLKRHNIFVMHVVPTSAYAVIAEEAGVDAVVAEGVESGGMTSLEEVSTFVLVPQVVDAVKCPVIAAGGIGDGRGLAAALALGADGVQMGTVFMATAECEISRVFKEIMIRARETDTRLVRQERSSRRTFKEEFIRTSLNDQPELAADLQTDLDFSLRGAGQIIGLVHKIQPVKEVIDRMIKEVGEVLPHISEKLS